MFRSLLTPLRTAFEDPRTPQTAPWGNEPLLEESTSPEDFAHDVRVEIIRRTIDTLRDSDDTSVWSEELSQLRIVLHQDASLKPVFDELDGFIIVVNVISALRDSSESDQDQWLTLMSQAFAVLSEALSNSLRNLRAFEAQIGFSTLQDAVTTGVDFERTPHMLGLFLSLSLGHDSLVHMFTSVPAVSSSSDDFISPINDYIQDHEAQWHKLQHPEAIVSLFNIATTLAPSSTVFYAVLKVVERIISASHRNQGLLNEAGLGRVIFRFLYDGSETKPTEAAEATTTLLKRVLRRLLEMGIPNLDDATYMLKSILEPNQSDINTATLAALRWGTRARWPQFFSFQGHGADGASLSVTDQRSKTFPPPSGFTFLTWIYIDRMPSEEEPLLIFGARSSSPSRWIAKLSLHSEGDFEFITPSIREALFSPISIKKGRWTHIALVHYPSKSSRPAIRLYIDGHQVASGDGAYPKPSPPPTNFHIGADPTLETQSRARWSMASCHLISGILQPELPLLIHHLGPRYIGNFQDALFRQLTYEAATSLNIHIFNHPASTSPASTTKKSVPTVDSTVLSKALVGGLGFREEDILFSLFPSGVVDVEDERGVKQSQAAESSISGADGNVSRATMLGDVRAFHVRCLDESVWRLGGPSIAIKLVQVVSSETNLTNALGFLFDIIRTSWQNSEAMESLQGYSVVAHLLRSKAYLLTKESFEVILDFLGLPVSAPENSTIVNPIAYQHIALDFHLWSLASHEVQTLYWGHFAILLEKSNFRRFNSKQRFAKRFGPGIIRQLLFVLQTNLYPDGITPAIVEAIRIVAYHTWQTDATIKPLVSYLAARLHHSDSGVASPGSLHSVMSRIDRSGAQLKAEAVFSAFLAIVSSSETHLTKLNAALPVARILILLLGTSPTPTTMSLVLKLVGIQFAMYSNFTRKLELVSFWSILKTIIPDAWDRTVQQSAFDLLFGRHMRHPTDDKHYPVVKYPQIFSSVLAALDLLLYRLADSEDTSQTLSTPHLGQDAEPTNDHAVDDLLEEFIMLHSTSVSFRTLLQSKTYFGTFVSLTRSHIIHDRSTVPSNHAQRASDKLCHLIMLMSVEDTTDAVQKHELQDLLNVAASPEDAATSLTRRGLERKSLLRHNSARSLQPDKAVQKALGHSSTWRATIVANEKKQTRRMYQDLRENIRAMQELTQWENLVHYERGLWPHDITAKWRLDEAEGPFRVRKKLEPENIRPDRNVSFDLSGRDAVEPEDSASIVQAVAPWDEAFVQVADESWDYDTFEDKHRKIRHELEPEDLIEDVRNVTRVVGVDSLPGLFILGRTHLYVRDGLVISSNGEILEARDATQDVLSVPGTMMELEGDSRARRWNLEALASLSKRTYLFRDVSLEIYFKDSRSLLCVFGTKSDRDEILAKLQNVQFKATSAVIGTPSLLRTPLVSLVSARVTSSSQSKDEIGTAQRRWQAREISNFAYISIINQASGRTPNDLTQYPVFPWVLSDYTSEVLDLNSPETFRDLTLPMGALNDSRREAAQARYSALVDIGEPPFHYGTHFSSSMITSHFLIRLPPFTRHFKALQGGDFDLADRLFVDIQRAYESASQESRGDVRELIPQFFTCPEFLENFSGVDLGTNSSGEKVNDVKLPPWAKQDSLLFIALHRKALESDYVSQHLPAWIDLMWGCKQRDVASHNVFHPLSYEGAVDLDSIKDPLERAASVGIIHNFGQTPRKIFSEPHPARIMVGVTSLAVGEAYGIPEDAHALLQNPRPTRIIRSPIIRIDYDTPNDRVVPCPADRLVVPHHSHEHIEWGFHDQSLRLYVDQKLVQVSEAAYISCAAFVDADILVTGTTENMVYIWRIHRAANSSNSRLGSGTRLKLIHTLRGHTGKVTKVAVSRAWSLIVSGSDDGSAVIWDLNRASYVRTIWPAGGGEEGANKRGGGVIDCAIHQWTGDIALSTLSTLSIHTLNGVQIVSLRLPPSSASAFSPSRITSLAFHEREYCSVGILATGLADGRIILRTWNVDDTPKGEKAKWKLKVVKELKLRMEDQVLPAVTALKFVGEIMYSGDDAGRLYSWTLPDE